MSNEVLSKTIEQEEASIISSLVMEFKKAETKDWLQKMYRHSRVWCRCHYFYAHACTYERYVEIQDYLKAEFKKAREVFNRR